ncbi:protein MCM10 homolog isoform X2 [Maniola jurtina]|uniref:protein MCM10 homolog isoform X1 n=1 Tax=Maniola jurtina TaxID=191418 RepID=UPI001E6888DA|nr:protein MCM10 homolog isoform X1 [Maniola jurtina]XP_045775188.1 protein MCM10 homolog isoform X2 [Maniola jurtina]
MEEIDELDQLDELLRADIIEETNPTENGTKLREVDIFETNETCEETLEDQNVPTTSAVHTGDTDSSDDEEKRNFTERKYNNYGTQIKKALDNQADEQLDKRIEFESRLRQTNIDAKVAKKAAFSKKPITTSDQSDKSTFCVPETKTKGPSDVYTDPIFGIRITKPLISSSALLDRMQGREAVNMLRVKRYVENEDLSKDWVIAGVIVRKSSAKKSQKGNNFVIWTLSDLKDDLKTVSMFLFRKAYNELWKTPEGTVVAVLNPNVLDRSQNSADQACLSVENSDRVMVLGQSKDLGICRSKKKNGEPCTAFVNLTQCEHCIYHVKQEYQKYSRRQELQSSTMGKGIVNLQNKVFGKSTFIYGGKSYAALPKADHKKAKDRDQNRLMSLSDYYKSEGDSLMSNRAPNGAGPMTGNSGILHSPTAQKLTDTQRLSSLTNGNRNNNLSPSQSLAEKVSNSPTLGKGFGLKGSGSIDLNMTYSQKNAEKAKLNAIRLIQQKGGIEKHNPNNIKGTETGKKRALDKLNNSGSDENDSKRVKVNEEEGIKLKPTMSERFKKILEATSAHVNLIKEHEDDEQEKYFNKLEKKEAMEEKMLNTFKLPCKAVRCVKCKYTAFSAAQICKDERHPLKVLDTFKRFFKCADCSNRTVSLEILPLRSCSNCKGSRWEKAPMLREKKVTSLSAGLSIRGEEETFIGGQVTAGKNIDLLVPDS